jgi:hypothetical protein
LGMPRLFPSSSPRLVALFAAQRIQTMQPGAAEVGGELLLQLSRSRGAKRITANRCGYRAALWLDVRGRFARALSIETL